MGISQYPPPSNALPPIIERNEGGGTWALRSTVTTNAAVVVLWVGSVYPPLGGGYMISGKDMAFLRS
jgi:hypothetical protein